MTTIDTDETVQRALLGKRALNLILNSLSPVEVDGDYRKYLVPVQFPVPCYIKIMTHTHDHPAGGHHEVLEYGKVSQ
jgi:hypothetical protein